MPRTLEEAEKKIAELEEEVLYLRRIIWDAKAVLVKSVVKAFTGEDRDVEGSVDIVPPKSTKRRD